MLFRLSLNEHFLEKISQFFKESTDLVGQLATGLFENRAAISASSDQ